MKVRIWLRLWSFRRAVRKQQNQELITFWSGMRRDIAHIKYPPYVIVPEEDSV